MRKYLTSVLLFILCLALTACSAKPLKIRETVYGYTDYERVKTDTALILCNLKDVNSSLVTEEMFEHKVRLDGSFEGEYECDGVQAKYSGSWEPASLTFIVKDSIIPNAEVELLMTDGCGYSPYPVWYNYSEENLKQNNGLPYLAVIGCNVLTSERSVSILYNLSVNTKDADKLKPIINQIVADINKSISSQ